MNSFNFKGISSDNFNIIVNSLPPISKPAMRVEETEIDGVDGIIFEDLGYESYEKKIKITITKNNVDEIIKWLNGEGDLVLSNEPNKYYKAKVIEQIDFENLIKYEPVEVTFRVQPFKYEYGEEIVTTLTEDITEISVENLGNCISKPIIKITGSGTINFILNGNSLFNYTFPEEENEVTIDSQKQDAYLGITLKNRNMLGEFPTFEIGENIITWDGNIESIEISSKSRWL